jgi:lipoprotein-anchoring transpeptidase ErfK/SrfK
MFTLPSSAETRLREHCGEIPREYLYVSVSGQRLYHVREGMVAGEYPVSTSRLGTGNVEGSLKTPTGIHRVVEKYGGGAPAGQVFKDRLDTGVTWTPADGVAEDLVLSRILRLEGLEPGVNRGPGIDSYDRYIYIHGTNKEHLVGTPNSHGCVCMTNTDVIDLFNHVPEGAIVLID